MSELIDQIRSEAQKLRQQFDIATTRASEVSTAADALTDDLLQAETGDRAAAGAARASAAKLETELGGMIANVDALVAESGSKAQDAAEEANLLFALITTSRAALADRHAASIVMAEDVLARLGESEAENATRIEAFESELTGAAEDLIVRKNELVATLSTVDGRVFGLDKTWSDHRDQWTTATNTQLTQMRDTVEKGVHEPATAAAETFRTLCGAVSTDVLTDPINELANQVRKEVSEELREALRDIVGEVEDLFEGFMNKLLESRDDGDKVDDALDEIIAIIEPAWQELYDKFQNVNSIASVVGM